MGGILKTGLFTVPLKEISKTFCDLINDDFNSRREDEDMYRGDFGSTHSFNEITPRLKETGKVKMQKGYESFYEKTEFEKYKITYRVIGHTGYVAQKLKVDTFASTKGKVILNIPKTVPNELFNPTKTFDSITDLKKYLENTNNPHVYKASEILTENYQKIGSVEVLSRNYKSRPKTLPKKYQWIDQYVVVSYGAINPF
ncbi:hypothetical protein ACFYSI_13100 [Staphylococcus xylosus]|uniref:hypothetical protein n=1 Tax=Staphylococcus xylosus TaxID=1288 RepID=UPI00368BF307